MVRILIVDDDEKTTSLLEYFLKSEGYEVDIASNGFAALSKISQTPFDLVLTDFHMPGPTGLDILPKIKKLQPDAAVIVLTGSGNEEIRRRSLERGASAYVPKPIHFHELKALIDEVLSSKKKKVSEVRNHSIG